MKTSASGKRERSPPSEEECAEKTIRSIPLSMAKLYQNPPCFDVYKSFAEIWPNSADPTPFAVVADVLADISNVGSRLACTQLLAQLFLAVMRRSPTDLLPAVYLVSNQQAPAHEGIELGIGDALLTGAIAECCGLTVARIKEEYRKTGDLAEVAQNGKKRQCTLVKPKCLMLHSVFKTFREVAMLSGKNAMARRSDMIKSLLRDAKGAEVNFIVRALQGKMRIGLAETTVLTSLGHAFALDYLTPEAAFSMPTEQLQHVLNEGAEGLSRIYHEVPSLDIVVSTVLQDGFLVLRPSSEVAKAHASELSIRPGLPVRPQLAHPTNGISTILTRFQGKTFTCEYKYDGERAQIHYEKGKGFHIFSRNSETHTTKYPDVIAMMPSTFAADTVQSFILDSEVVAIDRESGEIRAFQVLQHRGRKNIELKDVTIHVCVFAFDLLYLNGKSVMPLTLEERRKLLWSHFHTVPGVFAFASYRDPSGHEEMQTFLDQAIADGCEGLMVKALTEDATYTPARRSRHWLKLKKDYMDGVTDTLDLVPIAAFYGKGKRTGVFGGFLVACHDEESGEYQSICKIGTGFQDEMLEKLSKELTPLIVPQQPPYYRADEKPDVWLREGQVWEVKAADLSISPAHFAAYGLVDPQKGIALRFPRFLRIREDKTPTDATSAVQVADMYRQQSLALCTNVEKESG